MPGVQRRGATNQFCNHNPTRTYDRCESLASFRSNEAERGLLGVEPAG